MFSGYRMPICFVALLLLFTGAARAKTVADDRLGFSLQIPDDYAGDSQIASRVRNALYAFRKPGPGPLGGNCIVIQRQSLFINPRRATQADVPPGVDAVLFTLPWKGMDIDCIRIVENVGTGKVISCKARIPLKGQEIQVWATGNIENADQNRALLEQLVATVDGEINPQDPAVIASQGAGRTDRAGLIGATILAVMAGILVFWVIQRQFPRGIQNQSVPGDALTASGMPIFPDCGRCGTDDR